MNRICGAVRGSERSKYSQFVRTISRQPGAVSAGTIVPLSEYRPSLSCADVSAT